MVQNFLHLFVKYLFDRQKTTFRIKIHSVILSSFVVFPTWQCSKYKLTTKFHFARHVTSRHARHVVCIVRVGLMCQRVHCQL